MVKEKKTRKIVLKIGTLFLAFCFLLPVSCRLYRLEQNLNPEEKEFLFKVRYIITKEERKIFLELPPSERKEFIEKFWERRDPDPDTEINEFKEEYYQRIEDANQLFRGEGREGWLTDRGRIYIIFGPPTDRLTYPMGWGPTGRPTEVWYYGYFQVVFVDYYLNGEYRLVTENIVYLHELNKAQASQRKVFQPKKSFLDFTWQIKGLERKENIVQALIKIEIPYKGMWFTSQEEKVETTLRLILEVNNQAGQRVWEYKNDYYISMTDQELEDKKEKKHVIEVPLLFKEEFSAEQKTYPPGKEEYILNFKLINLTGQEETKKETKFNI
ncbi:MAG: GWxTD domain-containing protein [Candidatus Aminicenantia bacterium]